MTHEQLTALLAIAGWECRSWDTSYLAYHPGKQIGDYFSNGRVEYKQYHTPYHTVDDKPIVDWPDDDRTLALYNELEKRGLL